MTTLVTVDPEPRDPQRWPSSVKTSTLLLALEALARWREQLALTMEDPQKYVELSNLTEDWRTGPHQGVPALHPFEGDGGTLPGDARRRAALILSPGGTAAWAVYGHRAVRPLVERDSRSS